MKNIILTASIVTNVFIGLTLYAFTTGKVEKSRVDYVTELEDFARPVKLAKK